MWRYHARRKIFADTIKNIASSKTDNFQTQPALIESFPASAIASQQTYRELQIPLRYVDQQPDTIKSRFLDVVAEFISHTPGWHYVTVTALRGTDNEVLIDVVTNGGFDFTKEQWDNSARTKDALLLRGIERMVSRYGEFQS